MKEIVKRVPILGPFLQRLYWDLRAPKFPGSANYWEQRYSEGGNSGAGSYTILAKFKADILNRFVEERRVTSVIEFGCGDGNQLGLANYPSYLGVDVSSTAVTICRERFSADPTKIFVLASDYAGQKAGLSLSLDVVYHLVEDPVFDNYMRMLFDASSRYVIIYSSDTDGVEGNSDYIKHRKFNRWISNHMPNWNMRERIANRYPFTGDHHVSSFADFFIYEKM